MTSLVNKSQSIHGTGKQSKLFPEIASWLEKTRNEDNTEHNIDRPHHNWTSEPELWMYQPGLEPHSRPHRFKSKRAYEGSNRKNSIESPSTESSSEQEPDSSGERSFNPSSLGLGGAGASRKPFNMKSYGRKQYRRHKMKYGKKLQSSKSDSYHKKYIWDMVFNERAVVAIQQEFRQIQKLKAHSRKRPKVKGNPSILSGTSGDECSLGSINRKMPLSAAAAHSLVGDVDDLLLRSASQGLRDEKDKRKISQTGSALFAQFDLINERRKLDSKAGRHPAKSSSKEGSDMMKMNIRSGVLKRAMEKSPRDSLATPPVVSLENNYNSTGGTDSYNMSSGQTGITSAGYPGYPSIPYMDPMMLQAFMMQGIFNPMMLNYNYAQAQQQAQQSIYIQQQQTGSPIINNLASTNMSNYPSQCGIMQYPNLSSSSGGYPSMQQDIINQLSAGMMQTIYSNNKSADSPRKSQSNQNDDYMIQSPSTPKRSSNNKSNTRGPMDLDKDKESSEESEDIRPSRHAIDDKTNDLHPVKNSKRKEFKQRKQYQSSSGLIRSGTKMTDPGDFSSIVEFDSIAQNPLPKSLNMGNNHKLLREAPRKQKTENSHRVKEMADASASVAYSNSSKILAKKEKPAPRESVVDYLTQLKGCVEILKKSGWYWGNISGEAAMHQVERQGLGAFLIRDSTHQKFLFTLTVHTSNGPTNVRIVYRQGLFGLDCDNISQNGIKFDCVVKMIAHYVSNSKKYRRMTNKQKALKDGSDNHNEKTEKKDKNGDKIANKDSTQKTEPKQKNAAEESGESSIALLLLSPCRKVCPSLKHIARLAVHKKLARKSAKTAGLTINTLISDPKLQAYCQNYPHTV